MDMSVYVSDPFNSIAQSIRNLQLLACVNGPNPTIAVNSISGVYTPDPGWSFYAGNDSCPNYMFYSKGTALLILIGGATVYNQIANFFTALQTGPDPTDPLACNSLLFNAAKTIINSSFGAGGMTGRNVYIAGHSLGGAVAQVLAARIQLQALSRTVSTWSYGAPRPGSSILAGRLAYMQNARWYAQGDVVPYLPPHGDEMPSVTVTTAIDLWRACNTQVQGPDGYGLSSTGIVTPSMGAPPRDWGFTLGIIRYAANLMVGGAGPNHSVATYLQWMTQAFANYPLPVPTPTQYPEPPLVQRPRERDATIAIGEAEVFADATSPTGSTRTYAPPGVTDPNAPRYKAARDSRVWVVKLASDIVGSATGKRDAKRIARSWNKAARAALR